MSSHAAYRRRLKRLALGVAAVVAAVALAIAALWFFTPPVEDISDRVAVGHGHGQERPQLGDVLS
jgi:hypothetical protein